MNKTVRRHVAMVLAGSLLFAILPLRFEASAQSRQAEQSLSSLIGLLREAESLARTEMMPGELRSIREAANHAREGNLGSAATTTEMQRARTMLRHIIDDPRGESADFQEKIADSLKLVDDYLAFGDGNGLPVRTDTAFGLITTTFDTLEGTVSVNLPDDVAAGDTISGTVIAEPKGATKDEQAKNEDTLNGYVVEVAKQETPPQQKQGSKWIIPPVTQFIPVVLKNRQGKEVARTNVPLNQPNGDQGHVVNPKSDGELPNQGSYSTPPFGQAGRPVSVNGPFDGDFGNTLIKIGNSTAGFLAESPRKAVFRSPANLRGATTIDVNEQGRTVAKCTYQSIGIRLSAEKLHLIRGEQTTLTLTINGLNGNTGPVSAHLTNASPWVVRMEGGESQTIAAHSGGVNGEVFTAKRTLTGVKAGGFSINASVDPTDSAASGGIWRTCSGAPNAPPNSPQNAPPNSPPNAPGPGPESINRTPDDVSSPVSTPRSGVLNEKPTMQIQKPVLSEKNSLKDFRIDGTSEDVLGILPDLIVKEMCVGVDPSFPEKGATVLNVLVGNVGSKDSDPFELALTFRYSRECKPGFSIGDEVCPPSGFMLGPGNFYVEKFGDLKAGEERWFDYAPTSLGVPLVNLVARFQVIADPTYYHSYSTYDPRMYKVKSKITELTKKNNTLTVDRSEMRRCDAKYVEEDAPRIPGDTKLPVAKSTLPSRVLVDKKRDLNSTAHFLGLCGKDGFPDLLVKGVEIKKSDELLITVENAGSCKSVETWVKVDWATNEDAVKARVALRKPTDTNRLWVHVPPLDRGESKEIKEYWLGVYGRFVIGKLFSAYTIDWDEVIREEDDYNNLFILPPSAEPRSYEPG